MGLFSSKKRIIVGTSVSRAIEDRLLPNSIRDGALKGLFSEDEVNGTPAYVRESLVQSIGMKAERMYAWAANNYLHGLPSGRASVATQGRAEVEGVLSSLEGGPVLIEYTRFGPPNTLHMGWMQAAALYGYNAATNELTTLSATVGYPVYLEDLQVVVPPSLAEQQLPAALELWGVPPNSGYTPFRYMSGGLGSSLTTSPTPVYYLDSATTEHVRMKYVWAAPGWITVEDPGGMGLLTGYSMNAPHRDYVELPLPAHEETADYFHVRYQINGVTKFWMYRVGSGTYPTLDAIFDDPPVETGLFFPFLYFRYNKVSEISNPSSESYKDCKKMLRYLGMSYDMVAEGIEANPDIDDVEQAFLTFAIPANSTNPVDLRYLYEFFDSQYAATGANFSSPLEANIASIFADERDLVKNTIVIQDARFKMALSNGGIFKRRKAGSIGSVGSFSSGITTVDVPITYTSWTEDDAGDAPTMTHNTPIDTHYYRKQVSHHQYDEILVVNLKMVYHVYGEYHTTGDDTEDILLIPIDRAITDAYSIPDREILYARSLHYVFNSVVVQKVKWYQTGFFKFLMIALAVVIVIYTQGAGIEAALSGLAAGTITIQAIIISLAMGIVKSLVIGELIQLFIEAVGLEGTFLIALMAAAAALYGAYDAGSFANSSWAKNLLKVSTNLVSGIQTKLSDLMGDLADAATEFGKMVEDQTKLLETAQELLEGDLTLVPLIVFGESPNDFYNRTVHSGNIGVIGIDAVSSFVDTALTLPTLDQSLNGSLNV